MHPSRLTPIASFALLVVALGAAPIPLDKCIPGEVVAAFTVPSGQQSLLMPTDVAVDGDGVLYVADGANDRIMRFTGAGKCMDPWQPGLSRPTGIFVDRADHLWVADSGNHRVVCMKADGLIDQIVSLPPNHDTPAKPTDLLVTSDGRRLYVVDNDNHRILVREQATGNWTTLGSSGVSIGQFQYPFMIAVGANNRVYITETIGARVQVITADDRWAGQISRFGVELGELYRPKGIAINAKGRVFVSDSTLKVVQVFSSTGELEGVLTDSNRQPLRFDHPMGMTFDATGMLYVVELKKNGVAKIRIGDLPGGRP